MNTEQTRGMDGGKNSMKEKESEKNEDAETKDEKRDLDVTCT